jgi:hypothetical protein
MICWRRRSRKTFGCFRLESHRCQCLLLLILLLPLFCLSLLFSSLYVCVSFKLSSYKVVMVVAFSLLFFCLQVAADQFCFMLPLPSPFSLSLMFCSSSLVMRKRKSTSRRRDRGWLYVFAPSLSSLSFPSIPARRAFMYVRTNKNE